MNNYFILFPIAGLFIVGLVIALRSGDVAGEVGSGGLHSIAGTISAMFVRFLGYIAALLAVQQVIGTPSFF
ncbi:MAG: hypothetical protein NVSMB9_20970 [Isosphaeraceae bacterium]